MKFLAAAVSLVLAIFTGLLVALTVSRARLPYENGRYFDPVDSVVYDEGVVAVYGLLALVFAVVTLGALAVTVKMFRRGK